MSFEANGMSVMCRVNERLCALSIAQVIETLRPLPIEPIAGAREFILGLSVIRGVAVPVIHLGQLLGGLQARPAEEVGRFVTVRAGDRRVALAVTEVLGIRRIEASTLRALPPLLQDAASDTVSAIGMLDREFLLVLQSAWQMANPRADGQAS